MENLKELKHLVNRELDKIVDKGDITPAELECTYKIVKMLGIIDGMEMEENGYSGRLQMYYSKDDYSRDNYSGARMRNPYTGRYMSRDNAADRNYSRDNNYSRENYSGHNDMDLIKDLEMKLDYASNERERQAIIDTINMIKSKG